MNLARVERAVDELRESVRELEPARMTTSDAAQFFDVYSAGKKVCGAGETLVAPRATEIGRWKEEGHRSPASWIAEKSGTGLGEAMGLLETAERLESLPETTDALRRGELSAQQVSVVASTAISDPKSEKELLEAAASGSLKGLKDVSLRVKARSQSETDSRVRYEEIRKNRSVVLWTDHEGVGRLEARLTPDALGRVAAALSAESRAIFAEARKSGHHESPAAYAADALVALVTGSSSTGTSTSTGTTTRGSRSKSPAPRTMMHLRVDLAALRRGRIDAGEVCEIAGIGPVPLATAVNEIGESILKVVISDGKDVTTVCHLGRAVPAHIRSALEDRDETCVVPGCRVTRGLEIDHYQVAFCDDGPTELWNLARLCHWHHQLKTYGGFALTGGPGCWEWDAPVSESNPVLTA
jgi:hypothetical protein